MCTPFTGRCSKMHQRTFLLRLQPQEKRYPFPLYFFNPLRGKTNTTGAGDYASEMSAENRRVGAPTDNISLWYTLYYCGAGGDGWIKFWEKCDKCYDGGPGQSDFCGR